LRYGNAAGFFERLGKESIRFSRAFRGRKVIAALKINGIKFVDRHELAEFSRVVGLGLEALQLLTVICT